MSMMAEKLEDAGVDTIGARLTTACIDALRRHPESPMDAWRYVGAIFGHEFIRGLMQDMQTAPSKEPQSPPTPLSRDNHAIASSKPYQPQSRVISKERLEKKWQVQQIVRCKYKNSGGIPWSDVSIHESHGLMRDGKEAAALLEACGPNIPNDGSTYGEFLGVARVNEIIGAIRK